MISYFFYHDDTGTIKGISPVESEDLKAYEKIQVEGERADKLAGGELVLSEFVVKGGELVRREALPDFRPTKFVSPAYRKMERNPGEWDILISHDMKEKTFHMLPTKAFKNKLTEDNSKNVLLTFMITPKDNDGIPFAFAGTELRLLLLKDSVRIHKYLSKETWRLDVHTKAGEIKFRYQELDEEGNET